MKLLPTNLFPAYDWTAAAGELAELRDATGDDLDVYVKESAANAREHGEHNVSDSDLRDLHEWLAKERPASIVARTK